jgi:endo-alpha-1,4-polygalactosaminidase (GH114 family)
MRHVFSIPLLAFILFSCCKEVQPSQTLGSSATTSVYNSAYIDDSQKGFEADTYDEVLASATNSYLLLEPFEGITSEQIAALQINNNEIGAYISIGTVEKWRYDWEQLKPYVVEKDWNDWPDEFFVNETTTGILDVLKLRIDSLALLGYDWVEFDNMDWTEDPESRDKYGFETTEAEAITYYNELCDYVHSTGMKCMAKNTVKNGPGFDGVLYESNKKDFNWWDNQGTLDFLNQGKLVIINHYNSCDCNETYEKYIRIYNADVSFICSDKKSKKYLHYN